MKRRHHFVPRMYLKRFSTDERRISLLNIERRVVIRGASLREQCYRHRFHGPDDRLENSLATLEGVWAEVLRRVMAELQLPGADTPAAQHLITFVAMQSLRTALAADQSNALTDLIAKSTMSHDPKVADVDFDSFTVGYQHPVLHALQAAPMKARAMEDLAALLLITGATVPFITSDSPVVEYNPFLQDLKSIGATGVIRRGYLVNVPLSPTVGLLLYDSSVYRPVQRTSTSIQLEPKDTHTLNLMQAAFADKNLYFPDTVSDVQAQRLVDKAAPFRGQVGYKVGLAVSDRETEGAPEGFRTELQHYYLDTPNLHIRFRFLREREAATRIPLHQRPNLWRRAFPRVPGEDHHREGGPSGPERYSVVTSDWKPTPRPWAKKFGKEPK